MFDNLIIPSLNNAGYNRRLSIVIIVLASLAVLLVITSIAAFVYVTRKEKLLRRSHLASIIAIILIELAFLIAIITCCIIQSKNNQGQILAALLIVISFLALMTLIYFLLEDLLKERIEPLPDDITRSKSVIIQQAQLSSRHASPILRSPPSSPVVVAAAPSPPLPVNETVIPIPTSPVPSLLPTSPPPLSQHISPEPPLDQVPSSPPPDKSPTPPIEQDPNPTPESPPPYIVNYEKIRRDLLGAIEERTIPALEEAIQQVKDHNYVQQLKYECERALELLNRLMKIEHMRIKVLRLNQSTIAELHSYTKPPEEVLIVMRATFLLLGHSDREIQDWIQIQNLLGRFGKESIRRRCYELNPLSIPVDKAREAKDILRKYDLLRVNEISVGLAAFFNWTMTMVEEREKLLESQRRIVR